ncbi:protein kinase [Paenarthrobacter sp. Z7-10]|uniref:serine/threonine-protein kinase n=1 Tax=Paenarthrobacter sp. Z7-10 TaxID=2787635 RepID=UPI0022A95FBA|nr:serine/threonine-protein kinase [Paenarthrobacter sp. Z7-10]MCZ2404888.1 protein kinase [Paenarthrobacter sp. Z7-10]
MELLLGGRYRTADLLGVGGMATVYRAVDENLGRDVAVKLFAPTAGNAEDIRRQQTETQLLATLTHPGLVTLHDAGVHADDFGVHRSYLVMELVAGPDLRRLLADSGLDEDETAQIGAEIADALHYVHQNGVVHRDVKPANILMASSGSDDTRLHPQLSDFGIARMSDATAATLTGLTLGTANYLSPEQALGHVVTPASDIYSLGLVLLECLTGEKAFPGPTLEAALARLARDPEIPDSLGGEWVGLLVAMTARNPELRPSAHDVALELRSRPQPLASGVTETHGSTEAMSGSPHGRGQASTGHASTPGPETADDDGPATVGVLYRAISPSPETESSRSPSSEPPSSPFIERQSSGPVREEPITPVPITADPITADPITADPITAGPITAASITAGPITAGLPIGDARIPELPSRAPSVG